MFAAGHKSVKFTSCIGEPYGFLHIKQETQQWKEASDLLSKFVLTRDMLSQV